MSTPAPATAPAAAQEVGKYDLDDHLLDLPALAAKYEVHLDVAEIRRSQGLSSAVAHDRLKQHGPNALSPPKKESEWVKFFRHLTNPLLMLLFAAGILSVITYGLDTSQPINLYLGIILFVIILLSSFMGYYQERATSSITSAFKNMMPADAIVLRDGQERVVPAVELTLGDLVKLTPGSKVPADLRIVLSSGLKVEMSALTGEARPVVMVVDSADRESIIESRNIAFSSGLVIDGQALGVVVRIADNTYIGTIAHLASGGSGPVRRTTMYLEVQRFVRVIAVMALTMSTILAIVGFSQGQPYIDVIINAFISVIVANVPQGLPATVTSMLGLACAQLAKKQVYVKKTEIIESLGSASVVCSDKTGTLTMNLMSVEAVWCNGNIDFLRDSRTVPQNAGPSGGSMRQLAATGSMKGLNTGGSLRALALMPTESKGAAAASAAGAGTGTGIGAQAAAAAKDVVLTVAADERPGSFRRLKHTYQISRTTQELPYVDVMLIAAVNNSAKYDAKDRTKVIGDASEAALLRFCDKQGVTDFFRQSYSVVFTVPFSSATKFSAVVCEHPSFPEQHIILLKGAPEIVLEKCSSYMAHSETVPIGEGFRKDQKRAYERMASEGMRVLGFVRQIVQAQDPASYSQETFPNSGYQFVGMTGLTDPPKPGVPECILTLRTAGIRVFMVTGDHPFTAEAIGRQVNLITGPTAKDVAEDRGVDQTSIDVLADDEVRSIVLTGADIRDLPDEEWDRILKKPEIVFARTTPQQKLEIVSHVQRQGNIVAVTGDGVNDAPALKQSNIGVSMGKNASDVAREAAQIILMDDHFPNIVFAIEAGRLIFDNLKKTIAYTLTHLWPEVVPVILALLFGFPLGLQPLIVLTIDLGTELGPAISLSKEAAEADVMTRPPRDLKKDRLMSLPLMVYSYFLMGILMSLSGLIAYIIVFTEHGLALHEVYNRNARFFNLHTDTNWLAPDGRIFTPHDQKVIVRELNAATFFNIVTCQFWHIWVVRNRLESIFARSPFRNDSMNYGVIIALTLMVIIIWVPNVAAFFEAAPPPPLSLIPQLVFGALLVAYSEVVKLMRAKDPNSVKWVSW